MPLQLNLNFPLAAPNESIVLQDWTNQIKRGFIPGFASSQDKKVSECFTGHLKEILESEMPVDLEKAKETLILAQNHILEHRGPFGCHSEMARLEHYALAARRRLNLSDAPQDLEQCRKDNKSLLSRWKKAGFSEQIFWSSPDLVDFIFQAHLQRHINHPYYKHQIAMESRQTLWNGQFSAAEEPHLMFQGVKTPWSEVRKKIRVDSQARLYSKENGEVRRWTYLEDGFVPLNNDHFACPQRLRKLDTPPASCQVQIVTTHAHKEDWHLLDRILQGTRHSFIRLIPGEGFSQRYPEMQLEPGSVYSFGWGTFWDALSIFSPLSTLRGKWYSPDRWEFLNQDHCITTRNVTDAEIIHLMEGIRRRSKEDLPFNFITANCCGMTGDVLSEAGIIDLCTKTHLVRLKYEFFIPECIRAPFDKIASIIDWITPACVTAALQKIAGVFYSAALAPIFTILGAWRTKITFEEEEGLSGREELRTRAYNRIKALFTNIFDFFRPSKMEFDLTKNIYQWQLKQPGTVFEKRD